MIDAPELEDQPYNRDSLFLVALMDSAFASLGPTSIDFQNRHPRLLPANGEATARHLETANRQTPMPETDKDDRHKKLRRGRVELR